MRGVSLADLFQRQHVRQRIHSGSTVLLGHFDAHEAHLAHFLDGGVWELARLYAPDGHEKNLLTRAISAGVSAIRRLENPDALVSYADPNVGHQGGVYRAASWLYHGKCDKTRMYQRNGHTVARRAFHSGANGMTKAQIEADGWREIYQPGKHRFVKPLTRKARKALARATPNAELSDSRPL